MLEHLESLQYAVCDYTAWEEFHIKRKYGWEEKQQREINNVGIHEW